MQQKPLAEFANLAGCSRSRRYRRHTELLQSPLEVVIDQHLHHIHEPLGLQEYPAPERRREQYFASNPQVGHCAAHKIRVSGHFPCQSAAPLC
jgi:hypothetical protein